ncbi:uncharacterized protein NECHADRAFT_106375 [Fusarium vanettenii 77-13-4]|uniref:Chromatin assembly factor 1 subunit A n=1 Tax=Fusarium vanettenii (strain ATCC MYA-4622 / CBS 123669 / FGSC 9596 / NRRL 45880 / 77-13-4) TaxID=660122 RepID=C7YUF3_FUSV7|nr:uncharacterized protein NECHADRAFT_106375 [Fusarium vanettenii 77-13-4]EEU44403.1 hypothetical protein NECHADRAFT_106375 [Fusarium vanettenii 77-13-4]
MALLEMSLNIQETEATGRKRSHDEFAGETVKVEDSEDTKMQTCSQPEGECSLPSIAVTGTQSTSQATPDLTEAGSSTPTRKSPSPQTPVKGQTLLKPMVIGSASKSPVNPPKRKKLTPAEKEAREKELAKQKEEREEKAAIRAVEKAKAEAEKAAKAKEREEKKREKEEEKKVKDEEKKKRDEERKKKDEEKKRKEEEAEKKARQQRTLGSFFKVSNTPKKADDSANAKNGTFRDGSPVKGVSQVSKSEYEKLFKPFFIKDSTTVAPVGPRMDDETRQVKSKIVDECIGGQRAEELQKDASFDPVHLFALPGKPRKRGKLHHPVSHIMEHVYKETEKSDNSGADNADKIMREAREKLSKVPMKVIAFSQDVRPPYYGTVTLKTFALGKDNISQLARKPTRRGLPLDYDYDSEAEWQEEEGEDLDVDDDEEELDDEDDMEGFLDDSEDAGLSRRLFANTLEPESTDQVLTDASGDAPKLVKSELMDDVKRAILDNKALSKVGIIDFVFHLFREHVSRIEVKNTIELVAEKTGKGRSKEWALKHGHEIVS